MHPFFKHHFQSTIKKMTLGHLLHTSSYTIQGDHLTSGTFAVVRTSLFSSALFTLCCSRRTWGAKDHHHGDHDHHYQNHMHLYMTENPVELSPKSFWRIDNFRFLNSNCFFLSGKLQRKVQICVSLIALCVKSLCCSNIQRAKLWECCRINTDFWFFDGETKLTTENCTCWLVTGH